MALNIFRLLGDLSHLASIFLLVHKVVKSRSCRGISFKTQLCYLIVFLTRCAVVLWLKRETELTARPSPFVDTSTCWLHRSTRCTTRA